MFNKDKEIKMAKFKCKHSNAIYEFTAEADVKSMRKHPEYTEVVEEVVEAKPAKKTTKTVQVEE